MFRHCRIATSGPRRVTPRPIPEPEPAVHGSRADRRTTRPRTGWLDRYANDRRFDDGRRGTSTVSGRLLGRSRSSHGRRSGRRPRCIVRSTSPPVARWVENGSGRTRPCSTSDGSDGAVPGTISRAIPAASREKTSGRPYARFALPVGHRLPKRSWRHCRTRSARLTRGIRYHSACRNLNNHMIVRKSAIGEQTRVRPTADWSRDRGRTVTRADGYEPPRSVVLDLELQFVGRAEDGLRDLLLESLALQTVGGAGEAQPADHRPVRRPDRRADGADPPDLLL